MIIILITIWSVYFIFTPPHKPFYSQAPLQRNAAKRYSPLFAAARY